MLDLGLDEKCDRVHLLFLVIQQRGKGDFLCVVVKQDTDDNIGSGDEKNDLFCD